MKRILAFIFVICCLFFSGCGKRANPVPDEELHKITTLEELAELQYGSYIGCVRNEERSSPRYQSELIYRSRLILVRCKDTLTRRNTNTIYTDIRDPIPHQRDITYTSDRKVELLWCSDPDIPLGDGYTVTEDCGITEKGEWYFNDCIPMEKGHYYLFLISDHLFTGATSFVTYGNEKVDLNYLRLNNGMLFSAITAADLFMEDEDLPEGLRQALLQSTQHTHHGFMNERERQLYDEIMEDPTILWQQTTIASGYEKPGMEYTLHYYHNEKDGLWFFKFEDGFAYYYEE